MIIQGLTLRAFLDVKYILYVQGAYQWFDSLIVGQLHNPTLLHKIELKI